MAAETADPGSLLSHYRALIHLRADHPALQGGSMQLLSSGDNGVYGFLRCGQDEAVLVLVNLGRDAVTDYGLAAGASCLVDGEQPSLLLGTGDVAGPELSAEGGLADYQPVGALPPQSSTLILFR